MKKLISILTATTLIASSTVSVVACSSNANFREFKSWIKNEDSFLLYIGAKDCDYCQQFEDTLKMTNKELEQLLAKANSIYNAKHSNESEINNGDLTDFGRKIKHDKIDFHQFITDEKANNWNENWSKNIYNWIVEQIVKVYIKVRLETKPEIEDNYKRYYKIAEDRVKTYLSSNRGTPFYLLVRNGKLVFWEVGFEGATNNNHKEALEKWFKTFDEALNQDQIEIKIADKIDGSKPSEDKKESLSNFKKYNYNLDFNKYINKK